ncbi:UDP-2,4-diacetamido-2,4,6-trideoxy-beta-L-altropyranose hydrolase [Amylibacter sp.]|nr:UDP-2,4-diacetamido-2,4,6-trideoxy-beta-L-altropyranose hydrolase [Amylibacter sp.]
MIRADASKFIGTGHLYRCITLANALSNRGHEVIFLTRTSEKNLLKKIRNNGHKYCLLQAIKNRSDKKVDNRLSHSRWLHVSQEKDYMECISKMQHISPDWVVVDHYGIDSEWEIKVSEYFKGSRMLVIDDLADRKHQCDLLLDQTLGRTYEEYYEKVESSCKFLFGPRYSLLRNEFKEWRKFSLSRRKKIQVNRVLITLGGADEYNLTEKILKKLEKSEYADSIAFTVILGGANTWLNKILEFKMSSWLNLEIKVDVPNMAELMSNSDICIGASGSTTWERCAMGLPTIAITMADNQSKIAHQLQIKKICAVTSLSQIILTFDNLLSKKNQALLYEYSKNSKRICDGKGTERVVSYMGGN